MTTVTRNLRVLVVVLAATPAASAQGVNPYLAQATGGGVNPFTYGGIPGVNPYLGGGFGLNPYMGAGGGGYGGGYGGYGYGDPFGIGAMFNAPGQMLHGLADTYRSVATLGTAQEYQRILREQSMQAKIDTARRRFDFQLYVRANTPTFADETRRIARNTLKRIQISSLPQEITNGKSLNILLDDVRNHPYKKVGTDPLPLSDQILSRINVTSRNLGVGILRDGGKLDWPTALTEILSPEQRQAIDKQVQTLVANAANGKVDRQILDDLHTRMTELRNQLAKRVGEVPVRKFLDADEFLGEFANARQGIAEGQMEPQQQFQQFVKGGKTMQEVADYMVANGLRFAPAASRDDAAYRALHSSLVAFDVALNTMTADAKDAPAPAGGATP